MNYQEITDLMAKFDASSLTEFELSQDQTGLYMSKNTASRSSRQQSQTVIQESHQEPITKEETLETKNDKSTELKEEVSGDKVVSPIVGVVYLQPAPDKPAFKQPGDQVKAGEVVCIVEAMKLMNEITSPHSGTITEFFVTNEEIVEFNQPLFSVRS